MLIDWSQNDEHKTTVNVYSLRAKERPTVSTPVTWTEIMACRDQRDRELLVFDSTQVLAACRRTRRPVRERLLAPAGSAGVARLRNHGSPAARRTLYLSNRLRAAMMHLLRLASPSLSQLPTAFRSEAMFLAEGCLSMSTRVGAEEAAGLNVTLRP